MPLIKLTQVAKEINVTLHTCIDFLITKNIEVEPNNPNVRISEEAANLLFQHFSSDREMRAKLNSYIKAKREAGEFYKGKPIVELWQDSLKNEYPISNNELKTASKYSPKQDTPYTTLKKFAIVDVVIEDIGAEYITVSINDKKGIIKREDIFISEDGKGIQLYWGQHLQAKIIAIHESGIILSHKAMYGRMELAQNMENVYIIDTNVFLQQPDIMSIIGQDYKIVIPATVITEIDFHKNDSNAIVNKAARKSLRYINEALSFPNNIISEQFDKRFMPKDLDWRNNDDKILAIAIKLAKKGLNPIVMSSDIGIHVKAKANNITSISLEDFLNQGF